MYLFDEIGAVRVRKRNVAVAVGNDFPELRALGAQKLRDFPRVNAGNRRNVIRRQPSEIRQNQKQGLLNE
jgi:hypothetical protein